MIKSLININNKETLNIFWKVLVLFVLGIFAIATSAGALNYAVTAGAFYTVAGILNLGISGFGVYSVYKLLFKKDKKD